MYKGSDGKYGSLYNGITEDPKDSQYTLTLILLSRDLLQCSNLRSNITILIGVTVYVPTAGEI